MSSNETTTRSGRKIKKPDRWEPKEECEDDFGAGDYDTDVDCSDVSSEVSYDSDEETDEDDGSDLDDFIVDDDECDECDDEKWVKLGKQ